MFRKIRNITLLAVSVVLLLNIVVIVLVNVSSVQSKIVGYLTEWLSEKTQANARIGRVDIDLFNGVFLDDIYLEDQAGDTLLYAKNISANASLFSVYYRNKLHLQSASLSDFKVYLSKDSSDAPFNFQFLVDAFASSDTTAKDSTPSKFDLSIGKITLHNGAFRYDVKSDSLSPHRFNSSHIHIDSLMAGLRLNSIRLEKLEAAVDELSFKEWSGFDLDCLSLSLKAKDSVLHSELLTLELPHSQLQLADIHFDMRKLSMESHILNDTEASLEILPSHIFPPDLKSFLPELALLKDTLGVSASLSAQMPSAKISNLNFYYGDGLLSSLSVAVNDVCHPADAHFDLSLSHLFVAVPSAKELLASFAPNVKIPDLIEKSEHVELSLFAKGLLDDLAVDLDLNSLPGELKIFGSLGYDMASGDFRSELDLESNEWQMAALLDSSVGVGDVALRAKAQIFIPREGDLDVSVVGGLPLVTFKDYRYRDVDLSARYFGKNSLEAMLVLPDSNANISMKAQVFNMGADSMACTLDATVGHLSLYDLHLADEEMASFQLSTKIALDLQGNSLENLKGEVRIDSTYLASDTAKVWVERLLLNVAERPENRRRIDLVAPYFSLFIDGRYDVPSLSAAFTNMIHPYLPTFFPHSKTEIDSSLNDFDFGLHIVNTERLSRVLHLPILVDKPADIKGCFKPATKGLLMNGHFPSVKSGNSALTDVKTSIYLDDEKDMYVFDFVSKFGAVKEKYPLNLNLHTEAERDVVLLSLDYDNRPAPFKLKGQFLTLVSFEKEADDLVSVKLNFMPTDLQLNELDVEFEPAIIELRDKDIAISDFGFSLDGNPFLMVNGHAAASDKDSLLVSFHRASVHHLLSAVNMQDFPMDAFLDGTIHFYSLLGTPRFYTKAFHLDDITYQQDSLGSLLLNSRWSPKYQGMRVNALLNRMGEVAAVADGHLSPANDRIKFDVHFDKIPLALAELPLRGVMHDLSGHCGSDFQITGKLSAPSIDGYFYFKDAHATVDFTDVAYHITDTVIFSPNRIMLRNFDICDSKNKKLSINCVVHHKDFSDFRYTATMRMDNLKLLDNPSKKDSLLCGTFSASGVVDVKGDMESASVSGTLKNGDWTNVMIRLPESVTQVRTYDNIVYVSHSEKQDSTRRDPVKRVSRESTFALKADVTVDLTEDALFGAIISPATGDAISFRGAGNINAKYDSETSSTKLFGQYGIKEGNLKLKLSQLPIKSFSIKEGSQVYFNGDPMASSVDITAGYRVRADLALLDPSFASMGLSSTRVPVECGLNITGSLKKFDVKYDITLPGANEDLTRTVNSLITTDDIRIREFAYLLGFGMFYPPSGATDGSNSSIVSSLASSSLSGALNGALSGLLGDRLSIGTDVSSSREGMSDLEMNLSVSTNFFNNRLVLNTSLGYKNNAASDVEANDNSLIGNFDAEYKLTKSGMFRLKAYNHANNEFYNSSSSTKGLGVVFVKEAKTFMGLFDLRSNSSMNSPLLPTNDALLQDSLSAKRDTTKPRSEESHPKTERRGDD